MAGKSQQQNLNWQITRDAHLYVQKNPKKIKLAREIAFLEALIVHRFTVLSLFSLFFFIYKGVILMLAEQVEDRPHPWVEAARITEL